MEAEDYETFTRRLTEALQRYERVLALVAIGSMAEAERRDQWSDHDFWVVTRSGHAPEFLSDFSWLPDANDLTLTYRAGAQYWFVIYDTGHIADFGVFDPEDLEAARTNCCRVLFDKRTSQPVSKPSANAPWRSKKRWRHSPTPIAFS